MSARRVDAAARRYARALFEAASAQGVLDAVAADAELLGQVLAHPEVGGWLADPRVDVTKKEALLDREFGSRVHALTGNFLRVIGRRKRHGALLGVPAAFRALLDAHQGRLRGTVESAHELADADRERLEKALSTRTGKQVSLETRTDAELLGGVRVTLDGVRYDGSLQGRLDAARKRLETADLGS